MTMRVDSGGVGIEFDVHGEGKPVLLLHGFPDSARLWRNQIPALVDGGFQVIVPDQRGYGRSGHPSEVEAYSLPFLAGDALAVLDDLRVERAHFVGHDWGAAVAWGVASLVSDRVDHLVALSVGNPMAFAAAGFPQREKSWYMLLFQFRDIAEQWLSDDDWANFRAWMDHPDADAVIADLEATGSLTTGLNWYRANVAPATFVGPPLELPPVAAPTMGVWSTGDAHLTESQMTLSEQFVTGGWRYERLDGPGHHVQLEAPDAINELLVDFLPT
jgi:pimeloyl-ACP methyl ester carboxylesterase